MQSIDIREANGPPKSAKVLAGQDRGCKNGLGGTTASINAVRRSGSRKSPEHQRMFTEKQIRR
uniref:Uncharacterized protein n=1 Tax=Candidatus Methanogaster sp. ANME-2c ERB4 TaxID=2759911 RepID=A0A7G9Y5A4_9EURY|nr:hypothetical protein LDHBDEKG_00010 [Methanosarcinales archaeon ANME-2c ERB4]QNO43047.1 hypothetical protein HGKCJMEE_00025 [Methanosarcinales archaeon ANME-2c ERB4]QNO43188.1 hypothetical protein CEGDBGHB_00010 [Methanosarcinales archaeon ANME-2c ERB4]QNO45343.1 hypothetical protein IOFJOFCH_00003 [Methanosarcinales archaeon ANME-2c ERB4]QNO45673.1 hypothetical protein BOCBCOEP_00002 [Methanosarcinales archaeon ANME-2c ERB4]